MPTDIANDHDKRIGNAIERIQSAMLQGEEAKSAEPFYHLINDVIEKTKSLRTNRSMTWGDTFQKATFQEDETSTLGFKASFSIADSVTSINIRDAKGNISLSDFSWNKFSDEKLIVALEHIATFMKDGPDGMTSARLDAIKKFADSLPSSAYKDSIDTIYRASLFVALAASSLAFPPLIPFTAPVMGSLSVSLGMGYVVMGLACHIGLKGFLDHTSEEMFETERFNVIRIMKDLIGDLPIVADDEPSTEHKHFNDIDSRISPLLKGILEAKESSEISAAEAAKALKIVHKALQGDEKALEDLDNLHEKMKFSYYNDFGHFLKSAAKLAYNKYPVFASIVAVGAMLNAGTVLIPPLFIQLCNSMLVGAAAVIAYESPNIVNATAVAVSELPSTIHATANAAARLPSTIQATAATTLKELSSAIPAAAVAVYDLPNTIYTAAKNLPSSMRKPRITKETPRVDLSDDTKIKTLIEKLESAKTAMTNLRTKNQAKQNVTKEESENETPHQ